MIAQMHPGAVLREGHQKKLIALTGSFGSGKSTVANMLQELGACVINADKLGHEALLKGVPEYEQLAILFPEAVEEQGLNRSKVAEIVFHDSQKRKQLEAIVHPFVFRRAAQEILASKEDKVVLEIPLLFESGVDCYFDHKINVDASVEVLLKRMQEKGFSEKEVRVRLQAQLSREEKIKKSDFVINNTGDLNQTLEEVKKVWKSLS